MRGRALSPTLERWWAELDDTLVAGDHVLIMSNGGFDGVHGKLLAALERR